MAEVKNLVRSNVVSQVPYFITFGYDNAATKPVINLTEMWRFYNNQTVEIPLYGATNINASFNGKHAEWAYKYITLTGSVTNTDKFAPVFTNGDEALFTAGVYFQSKQNGEIILVEKVDTTTHTVYMRRALFNTEAADFNNADVFYQLNTIEVTPDTVSAVQGVYTVTVGGTVASGDVIKVNDTTITLDSTSGASTTAAATAVKNAFASDADYTVTSSGAVVTFTEKSGHYGAGVPTASITSTAGTVAVATTTAGSAEGYASGVGTIWANPLMGPSQTGYYRG